MLNFFLKIFYVNTKGRFTEKIMILHLLMAEITIQPLKKVLEVRATQNFFKKNNRKGRYTLARILEKIANS